MMDQGGLNRPALGFVVLEASVPGAEVFLFWRYGMVFHAVYCEG
jgi:hypothetical protein